MNSIYVTGDAVGTPTGGGLVTKKESATLRQLGTCKVFARSGGDVDIHAMGEDPWHFDNGMCFHHDPRGLSLPEGTQLAHFYSGTFSKYIRLLKEKGIRTSYTAAAHDVQRSKDEHLKLGFPYNYPHLTTPELWREYVAGYKDADLVICPSNHSKQCMESYGCKNVVVIPHGVDLPDESKIKPLPKIFTIGYLGSFQPDKGVIYLIQAWGKLNYRDAVLVLAGRDSNSPYVRQLVQDHGGTSNICLKGWINNPADFYNSLSLYVQPSVTEGFGCEVTEAMAYKRPVMCSRWAGAVDLVPLADYQEFCHDEEGFLEQQIDYLYKHQEELNALGYENREVTEHYTWDSVCESYQKEWEDLVNGRSCEA